MLRFVKRLLFGDAAGPRRIWFGIGSGARFHIDASAKSQRIVGLDEAEIASTFRRSVLASQTFIDVGASDGYYPIIALRLNPTLTAIACEPQTPFAESARQNYRLNFSDSGQRMEWVPKQIGCGPEQMSLDQLADGRSGPFFIKIDVDGGEVEVLRSGLTLLGRDNCRVLVEVHSAELEAAVIQLLESQKFTCRIVPNAWWRCMIPEHRPIALNRWVYAEKATA